MRDIFQGQGQGLLEIDKMSIATKLTKSGTHLILILHSLEVGSKVLVRDCFDVLVRERGWCYDAYNGDGKKGENDGGLKNKKKYLSI